MTDHTAKQIIAAFPTLSNQARSVLLFRFSNSCSSLRSVVMSSFSSSLHLISTATLLLFVLIRALPRSKCVISINSASERCKIEPTRWASSSSRFKITLVLELLMIPLPYLPSSSAKKSLRSCVAQTAEPP